MRFGELRLAHRNLLARVTYSARKFSLLSVAVYGELTASLLFRIRVVHTIPFNRSRQVTVNMIEVVQ
ncbi:MAG: hypothetical protein LZF86_180001 [Nitrospira sp.]|nr:MAG: hypothetical protein LZF86_180001 [Nitrospira sp.]